MSGSYIAFSYGFYKFQVFQASTARQLLRLPHLQLLHQSPTQRFSTDRDTQDRQKNITAHRTTPKTLFHTKSPHLHRYAIDETVNRTRNDHSTAIAQKREDKFDEIEHFSLKRSANIEICGMLKTGQTQLQ